MNSARRPLSRAQSADNSVAVLSSADVQRIHRIICPPDDPRKLEMERLREMSRSRTENWTGTEKHARQLREARLKEREEKRRAEEQAMDDYSAELQEHTRKEAHERALHLLMKDSDISRRLQSGLMMSDVVKERDKQVLLRKEMHDLNKLREKTIEEEAKERARILQEQEEKEKAEKGKKSKEVYDIQKQQIEEYRRRCVDRLREAKEEGEKIQAFVSHQLETAKKADEAKRLREKETQKQLFAFASYADALKEKERKDSEEEDRRNADYVKRKQEISHKIHEREKELTKKKMEGREIVLSGHAVRMTEVEKEIERRNEQYTKEKEEERIRKEAADQEKRREDKEKVLQAWKQQLDVKEAHKRADQDLEARKRELLRQRAQEIEQEEAEEIRQVRESKVRVLKVQQKQAVSPIHRQQKRKAGILNQSQQTTE
eukprot:TRINITY_DN3065_c0_g3_i6.p1 TRINITY_DN3065_c0_g3~~TRINITY_DN3065_c0_g3_i6.p1  ORF type:complete len:432 (+),score=123.86 TRINITY_DN3065_c0_g3_i6:189-1484(+)